MKKLFLPESLSGEGGIYFSIISPITECSILTRYYHTDDFPRGRLERGSWRSDSRDRVLYLEKGKVRTDERVTGRPLRHVLYAETPSSCGRYLSSEEDKSYFASSTLLPPHPSTLTPTSKVIGASSMIFTPLK